MKPILFLGAKSDIAKTTAVLYAKNGYSLYLAGRQVNTELIDFSRKLTQKYGCNVELFELDILSFETHQLFFESLPYKPEGVLCFIGYLGNQKESELDFKESRKIIDTNFTGIISLLNIFANYFEDKKGGFIVGVSSVAGDRGRKSNYTYGSAKAALSTYLSGLRNRLSESNVAILTIKPGYIKTKMTDNMNLPSLLTVSPNYVSKRIYNLQQRKAEVCYLPGYWYLIMVFIKTIPETIFKRLSL